MQDRSPFLDAVSTGRGGAWRSIGGAIAIFATWQIAMTIGTSVAAAFASKLPLPAGYTGILRLWGFFWAPIGLVGGLWLVQTAVHGRTLLSLVTARPHIEWRRIATGAAVWAALLSVAEVVAVLLAPGAYRLTFQPGPFFASLVALVPLIALQALGEEMFFRGYLLQAIARYTRSWWLLVPLGATLFSLPHLGNPEVGSGGWAVVASYALMGGFLTAVALRDDRLELAIGLHVANNLAAAIVVGTSTSVIAGTAPVFTTAESSPLLALAVVVIQATVFWLVVFRPWRTT